jgi:hypothetical protein
MAGQRGPPSAHGSTHAWPPRRNGRSSSAIPRSRGLAARHQHEILRGRSQGEPAERRLKIPPRVQTLRRKIRPWAIDLRPGAGACASFTKPGFRIRAHARLTSHDSLATTMVCMTVAGLENRYTSSRRVEGSNPSPSALNRKDPAKVPALALETGRRSSLSASIETGNYRQIDCCRLTGRSHANRTNGGAAAFRKAEVVLHSRSPADASPPAS